VTSSLYENKIKLEGYNDVDEHIVKLYSINRAQEISDPVSVSFTPLESSLNKVSKTVKIERSFGGAQFSWFNKDKSALTFDFMAQDSTGSLKTMKIITSQSDSVKHMLHGFKPEPRVFAALVMDNWGNVSDTIYPPGKEIVPLYEEKLDKSRMSIMKLGSDANFTNFDGAEAYLIDDDISTYGHTSSSSLPASFTIDLGETAKLSRLVMYQRQDEPFCWGNPKNFEVYGCQNRPSQDGDWDDWTWIMHCTIIKPSGSPVDTNTDEDMAALKAGHEFVFDLNQPPVRYVRIKIIDTWEGSTFTHPAEVTLYGAAEE
jgi:hypothetical protein